MKNILKHKLPLFQIFTALVFLGLSQNLQAKDESPHIRNLNTTSLQIFRAQESLKQSQVFLAKQIDAAYTLLENSAKDAMTDPEPELLKSIFKMASIMIENDPSQSAAEPLVPLMKRHKEACQKAISAVLNANDAAELKSAVQASSKEADEGNG